MIYNKATGEIRSISLVEVPEHKRSLWLPVVEEGSGPQRDVTIEEAQVRIVYSTPVPQSVSPYQARRALTAAGLRETVEAAIQITSDQSIKDAWEYGTVVERNSPFIAALAQGLNLSDAQIDNLFIEASKF